MLLRKITLHCLYTIKDERTVNSIYHLLTGKQSIQTIQDAHLFHLERFFALYKHLRIETFNEHLLLLTNESYIEKMDGNKFLLTPKGLKFVKKHQVNNFYWNGMKFHQIDEQFMQRLFLLIQVWTNRQAGINRYIPIVDDANTTAWVRSFYRHQGPDVTTHLRNLYEELVAIFSQLPTTYPTLFMKQITTDHSIGLTDEQLANEFDKSTATIYLMYKNYVHFLLMEIQKNSKGFPLLLSLANHLHKTKENRPITNSAKVTETFVKRNFTPEQIAAQRQLKVTTIYDHIVEIALHDNEFPLERFVTPQIKQEIYKAVTRVNSFKLKEIKGLVSEEISYFQIRLALTRINKMLAGDVDE